MSYSVTLAVACVALVVFYNSGWSFLVNLFRKENKNIQCVYDCALDSTQDNVSEEDDLQENQWDSQENTAEYDFTAENVPELEELIEDD